MQPQELASSEGCQSKPIGMIPSQETSVEEHYRPTSLSPSPPPAPLPAEQEQQPITTTRSSRAIKIPIRDIDTDVTQSSCLCCQYQQCITHSDSGCLQRQRRFIKLFITTEAVNITKILPMAIKMADARGS
ncbi:hypothetical protein ElyMa_006060600 [Elysia marginata]|uniref:Uncharacterized protein n=1 Tax=Elysia marginata TaxID=1093978 RepID=A0AAV4GQ92_9GAST|nr:hypothetical protein ElyMa_006060600 [Elysia marginata]